MLMPASIAVLAKALAQPALSAKLNNITQIHIMPLPCWEEAFLYIMILKGVFMKKPLIGLTPGHDADTQNTVMRPTYLKALEASGAIPLVLPLKASPDDYRQLAENLDGFVFTGGPDPHPFLFMEETHSCCGNVSRPRDTMEIALLSQVLNARKPVLGICRGIQIINVALGGSIYQDIPSQYSHIHPEAFPLAHRQPYDYHIPSHFVDLEPSSRLAGICGALRLQVNSMHHQAVKEPAGGLRVCATASDGLIEGLEMPDYPWLVAVQWHPEYLWEQDSAARRLFADFTAACSA